MSKTSNSLAWMEADDHRTYPSDLTPALQQALAMLADIDIYYDDARQKLERWPGPDAIKQRFSEQLEARRQLEREPLLRRFISLEQQIRSRALFEDHSVH